MLNSAPLKPIRSFVKRQRGMTAAKERTIATIWPKYGLEVANGMLNLATTFKQSAPITIEIGFGNGETLWTMATQNPQQNFIGIEVHRPGISNLCAKLKKNDVENLRLFAADAIEVLTNCIPNHSIDRVLIFFPDPWPKRKHHKRRLIQPTFINLIATKLKAGGILHIATDWADYAQHVITVMQQFPNFKNLAAIGDFAARPEYRPLTKFEKRGQQLGHQIYDLIFCV